MKNIGLSPSRTIAASQTGQNNKRLQIVIHYGYPINPMNMYNKFRRCMGLVNFNLVLYISPHKRMYVVICIGVQAMACDLNVMPGWYWFMVWNGIWSDFWHSQELCGLERN
jgi:hypothetical protein